MGGCSRVLENSENIPVDLILLTGQTDDSATWKRFTRLIQEKAIPVLPLVAGQQLDWGGGVQATVFNPRDHSDWSPFDEYDDCHVLLVEHGDVSFLFVGDLPKAAESLALTAGLPSAQILKVAEHGGNAGSSTTFLTHVSPQLAIISASAQNAYGHPHPAVRQRLEAAGAQIVETSVNGTITVTSDGAGFTTTVSWGTAPSLPDADECDDAYPDFCIPSPPPDLNCSSPQLADRKRFAVLAPDPHHLDPDHDGIGCES
jgi:beta-lactamase superfamily II metal-dependent hydrolase